MKEWCRVAEVELPEGVSVASLRSCRQLRGCPASLYLICPVYARHDNCWDSEEGCMDCWRDCENCKDYAKAVSLGLVKKRK
ncbi:MAG: hypothetical protein QME82_00085 [Bacillota bacterium]|nr:hypothetical protein [Bacillota bacterium]MDI6637288.1 hypothetical protein [Bacillota bacterium]